MEKELQSLLEGLNTANQIQHYEEGGFNQFVAGVKSVLNRNGHQKGAQAQEAQDVNKQAEKDNQAQAKKNDDAAANNNGGGAAANIGDKKGDPNWEFILQVLNKHLQGQPQAAGGASGDGATQAKSADGSLDEIKDFVGKNPDITDWPEEPLNKLIGFLNGLDEFRNSKKAQAAIKAIQQVEKENGSGGGNADNAAGANNAAGQNNGATADNQNAASAQGNPSNVPSGDLTTAMTRLTGLVSGAYTAADLEAAIKQKQGK